MSGEYIPPSLAQTSKQANEKSFQQYSQYMQIDSQNDKNQKESKIGRKGSWMTSASSIASLSSQTIQIPKSSADVICFDGIKQGLIGALNLFMRDNFTSYIVRGLQARNPNVGVVQILANQQVQKCKNLLQSLRIECFVLISLSLAFLLASAIIGILTIPTENSLIITLIFLHLLATTGMIWSAYSSARYFLLEKIRISLGLTIIMLFFMVGVILEKNNESDGVPNRFSVLLLSQFALSGLLFFVNRQIYTIYHIFV